MNEKQGHQLQPEGKTQQQINETKIYQPTPAPPPPPFPHSRLLYNGVDH